MSSLENLFGHDSLVLLGEFVTDFIQLMIHKYIGVKRNRVENLTIEDDLSVSRYTLPFFATPPERDKTESSTVDFTETRFRDS